MAVIRTAAGTKGMSELVAVLERWVQANMSKEPAIARPLSRYLATGCLPCLCDCVTERPIQPEAPCFGYTFKILIAVDMANLLAALH